MKQIEQEEAERMEQSIRFTVLDPLQARLERHDQLREQIGAWEKLAAESKMLRAVTLKMQSSRLEDDDKRAQTEMDLHRVAEELQEAEKKLLPQLVLLVDGTDDAVLLAAASALDLFSTTIPLAVKLTTPGVSLSTTASKLNKMSSLTSDGWTEVDGSSSSTAPDGVEAISGSDEECNESHITLEDFEAGRLHQVQKVAEDSAKIPIIDTQSNTAKLVTLASYEIVTQEEEEDDTASEDQSSRIRRSTSPSPRTANFRPITPRRTVSMFSSIRKTIRGKFNYSGVQPRIIRQSSAPPIDTSGSANQSAANSPRKSGEQLIIIPQSPTEWLAIEECLWEIDAREARSPGKALLTADSISSGTEDLLTGLFQKHDGLYFECLSYLRVEDLARLSKVNFRLHSHLVDTAPIWKKCIRSGGLSESIRSSLWLSVFYESTPWRSSGIASHYLSADRRCSMYEQLLEKVGTKLAVGLDAVELSLSEDDAQLAVWFREIDVDVVRTCHRSIYAKNGDAMPSSPSASPSSADDDDDDDEDTVKSILSEMIELVVIGEGEEVPSTDSHDTPAVSSSNTRNPDLEAKIRRVLRAYVVYNPRVGYCQGMGFLVRLLAEVAVDEADIFWLFVGFSEPENDRNLYEPGMAVLQPYLSKFELLFSTHMPELYTHFQTEGVHVATFCTRWFLTFFSSFETLAPTLVIRLLDIFIIDGWRVMFSVSLVILDELQEELMKCDMEGILRVLQFPRSLMPDPDQLRQRQLVRHALAFSISRAINSI
ncbi:hypothetical protein ON010_g10147 [Phytophthora cinnamomi]|nr:hypothetical protein ON010_g10147 [Phytophthora cinnamomi]